MNILEREWRDMYSFLGSIYYKYFDIRKREYKRLYNYFRECESVLDIACGIGDFCRNGKNIIGVDHNKDSLAIAKKHGCKVVYGDVLKLPFKAKAFDGIFCAHLIEHFNPDNALKLLSEMNRVLRKGGILLIQTPLLHKGFYNDFTHHKVYAPEAIMHYLSDTTQTNLGKVGNYKVVSLQYRYAEFFTPFLEPSRRPPSLYRTFLIGLKICSLLLYFVGIKNYFSVNGYTLVLQKQ